MNSDIKKNFKKNLFFAFAAQGLSFVFSFLMSLLVPKLLGVEQFSYWQLFIFYSGYVGFFHFGLSDGVYLKYGGIKEENLNKSEVISQYWLMVGWQLLLCIIALAVILTSNMIIERKIVWIFVIIFLLFANSTWYWGYVFQAANQTRVYSLSTIIAKIFFILAILAMFIIKPKTYFPFVALYVISQFIAMVYVFYKSRRFFKAKLLPLKNAFLITFDNIKIGINLTISNIVSSLILGVGRAMVDKTSGIASFGMLSLSVSLTNFFLQFITAISMVMFPALRQINEESMKKIFLKLRSGISYLLCVILLLYVPMKVILSWWLPQYKNSLTYLAFLLPICIFDGKMQLLFNTYMKVYRKERMMLLFNIISLIVSAVLCAIGAFAIKSIVAVALAMTIAIIIRSIIANVYLSKIMKINIDKNTIFEVILAVMFILLSAYCSDLILFIFYGIAYATYLIFNKNEIKQLLRGIVKSKSI